MHLCPRSTMMSAFLIGNYPQHTWFQSFFPKTMESFCMTSHQKGMQKSRIYRTLEIFELPGSTTKLYKPSSLLTVSETVETSFWMVHPRQVSFAFWRGILCTPSAPSSPYTCADSFSPDSPWSVWNVAGPVCSYTPGNLHVTRRKSQTWNCVFCINNSTAGNTRRTSQNQTFFVDQRTMQIVPTTMKQATARDKRNQQKILIQKMKKHRGVLPYM